MTIWHRLSYSLCLLVLLSVGRIHSNPLTDSESSVQVEDEKTNAKIVKEPQAFPYDSLVSLGLMSRSLLTALTKELTETTTEAPPLRKSSLVEDPLVKSLLTLFFKEDTSNVMKFHVLKFIETLNLNDGVTHSGETEAAGVLHDRYKPSNQIRRNGNFLRENKGHLLLHAAAIGTSIAALSTAIIAFSSKAANTLGPKSRQHVIELADEYILEPIINQFSNWQFDSGAHQQQFQQSFESFPADTVKRKLDTAAAVKPSTDPFQRATNRELQVSKVPQTSSYKYFETLEKVMQFIDDYQRSATDKDDSTGLPN